MVTSPRQSNHFGQDTQVAQLVYMLPTFVSPVVQSVGQEQPCVPASRWVMGNSWLAGQQGAWLREEVLVPSIAVSGSLDVRGIHWADLCRVASAVCSA